LTRSWYRAYTQLYIMRPNAVIITIVQVLLDAFAGYLNLAIKVIQVLKCFVTVIVKSASLALYSKVLR
jgi:hypothetical protein